MKTIAGKITEIKDTKSSNLKIVTIDLNGEPFKFSIIKKKTETFSLIQGQLISVGVEEEEYRGNKGYKAWLSSVELLEESTQQETQKLVSTQNGKEDALNRRAITANVLGNFGKSVTEMDEHDWGYFLNACDVIEEYCKGGDNLEVCMARMLIQVPDDFTVQVLDETEDKPEDISNPME